MSNETLDDMTAEQEATFIKQLEAAFDCDDGAAAREHLAAGEPIYYREDDTPPGLLIKQLPDGHRQLVQFTAGSDNIVREL